MYIYIFSRFPPIWHSAVCINGTKVMIRFFRSGSVVDAITLIPPQLLAQGVIAVVAGSGFGFTDAAVSKLQCC